MVDGAFAFFATIDDGRIYATARSGVCIGGECRTKNNHEDSG